MDKEAVGATATQISSAAACVGAASADMNDSTILLIFSALGAFTAIAGLLYQIWNGNRNYRLQREKLKLRSGGIEDGLLDDA